MYIVLHTYMYVCSYRYTVIYMGVLCFDLQHDNKKMVDLFLDNLENRGVNDWYLLGICIGLRKDQLDAIKHNESSRCLLDVVHLWLMKNPSFDELIKQCDCVNNPNKMTLVKCDHMCMHPERYLRELEKHGSVSNIMSKDHVKVYLHNIGECVYI